ncbi:hypothetical protein [Microbulbifer sp. TRSA005]|uniref:hypothetical protein n=1 Tax=unclassified Microbulbifer TaxID=2619833 RepID=UPI004039BF3B
MNSNYGHNPYMPDWETQYNPAPSLIQQPQAQQQSSINPMQAMSWYNKFAGVGASGAGSTAGGTASTGAGSGAAGGSSWIASLGPWAALAVLIGVNENEAREGGYRDEDDKDYALDLLGGKVFEQDATYRWKDDLNDAAPGSGSMVESMANLGSLDFSNAGKAFEDGLKEDPLIKGILSLF